MDLTNYLKYLYEEIEEHEALSITANKSFFIKDNIFLGVDNKLLNYCYLEEYDIFNFNFIYDENIVIKKTNYIQSAKSKYNYKFFTQSGSILNYEFSPAKLILNEKLTNENVSINVLNDMLLTFSGNLTSGTNNNKYFIRFSGKDDEVYPFYIKSIQRQNYLLISNGDSIEVKIDTSKDFILMVRCFNIDSLNSKISVFLNGIFLQEILCKEKKNSNGLFGNLIIGDDDLSFNLSNFSVIEKFMTIEECIAYSNYIERKCDLKLNKENIIESIRFTGFNNNIKFRNLKCPVLVNESNNTFYKDIEITPIDDVIAYNDNVTYFFFQNLNSKFKINNITNLIYLPLSFEVNFKFQSLNEGENNLVKFTNLIGTNLVIFVKKRLNNTIGLFYKHTINNEVYSIDILEDFQNKDLSILKDYNLKFFLNEKKMLKLKIDDEYFNKDLSVNNVINIDNIEIGFQNLFLYDFTMYESRIVF